ncbi:MAG: 50S ribosomal protein L24 [Candidatus Thermoplasmatota archaeon]
MSDIKMSSKKPRKQRKNMYNAPHHRRRKNIAAHLEEDLLLKYDRRSVTVIEGDTVKIMRGSFRGLEDKVVNVDTRNGRLEVEGAVITKADGNRIGKPIHPSNVLITKLNLTDKWRRKKLEERASNEAREEIEKEAEEQIKEQEEEERKRKEEEEEKAAEAEEVEEEPSEEEEKIEEKTEKKTEKQKESKTKKTEKKTAGKKSGSTKNEKNKDEKNKTSESSSSKEDKEEEN